MRLGLGIQLFILNLAHSLLNRIEGGEKEEDKDVTMGRKKGDGGKR